MFDFGMFDSGMFDMFDSGIDSRDWV
jgi:hypothetical protein